MSFGLGENAVQKQVQTLKLRTPPNTYNRYTNYNNL